LFPYRINVNWLKIARPASLTSCLGVCVVCASAYLSSVCACPFGLTCNLLSSAEFSWAQILALQPTFLRPAWCNLCVTQVHTRGLSAGLKVYAAKTLPLEIVFATHFHLAPSQLLSHSRPKPTPTGWLYANKCFYPF